MFLKPNFLNNITDDEIFHSNPKLIYYQFAYGTKLTGDERLKFLYKFSNITLNGLKEYRERQEKILEQLENDKYITTSFEARTITKCIPGMGYFSSLETGINLHFLYGFPYISSTTLKGITSDYAIFYENIDQDSEEYKNIFGSQNNKGEVIFFDALPVNNRNIFTIDVMTPHFGEYYTKNEPPADYLNPTPITFICIKENVNFKFYLASKNENSLKLADKLLKGALENIGVGAKTSLGYGLFKVLNYEK